MFDQKPTNALAADQLRRFVRPLSPGDAPFLVNLLDETNRPVNFGDDWIAGCYVVAVFVASLEDEEIRRELAGYHALTEQFEELRAKIAIISASSDADENRRIKKEAGFVFPVLGDAFGGAFAAYGIHKEGRKVSPTKMRSVVITPYRQIRCFWDIEAQTGHAKRADEVIRRALLAEEMKWTAPHPPVLVVPQVFTPDECARLIKEYHETGPFRIDRPKPSEPVSDYKLPTYEYGRQDRIDHVIKDQGVAQFIDERVQARLVPAVKHAFAFDITRREDFHIARYAGARGGARIGHRDNKTATRHRRFALSLNLNDDYEGGEVVFREYSQRGYKNPAGSALVFSSSLLHEVLETTKGVRYTLISHFFNDDALRESR